MLKVLWQRIFVFRVPDVASQQFHFLLHSDLKISKWQAFSVCVLKEEKEKPFHFPEKSSFYFRVLPNQVQYHLVSK
jgi:hypothetical protein